MFPSTERDVLKLSSDKQVVFWSQYNSQKKSPGTALALCFFLGGLGVHEFYLGKVGWGIIFALFCWTFIPALIALIQCFGISGRVDRMNNENARRILLNLTAPQQMGQLEVIAAPDFDLMRSEIGKLDEMLAAGTITTSEYQALRKKALGI
ncbi:MAG: TM2 domain-containing protein [Burkholderiaceae bacterium]